MIPFMLIMAVAPLASIVRLLVVLYNFMFSIETQSNHYLFLKDLVTSLKSNNLHDLRALGNKDVEEIIKRHFHVTSAPGINTFLSVANPNSIQVYTFQSDLRLVILWLVVFIVLVIIPGFIMVITMLRSSDHLFLYPGQQQMRGASMQRKSRAKISKLIKVLDQYQMELGEENLIQCQTDFENETMLKIPCAGHRLCDEKEVSFRTVISSCAICLSCYQSGERIVWSSNSACPHLFHHDCMITWMNKRRSIDCPCCRQQFVVESS